MSRSLVALVALMSAMPLAVEVPGPEGGAPRIPGTTRVQVAGGYAYYAFVARGCEGNIVDHVPVHTLDGAVSVDHRIEGTPFRIGVRGGWLRDRFGRGSLGITFPASPGDTYVNRYVNPHVEFDAGRAALGVGWVSHQRQFLTASEAARDEPTHPLNDLSGHVRFGSVERHFVISWMEGMPVATDGGYLAMGFGGRLPARRLEGFVGMGAGGPLEGAGPMLRANLEVVPDVRVELKLRGGFSGNITTGSAALGIEYRRTWKEARRAQ